ncbi:cytochrome c [Psychromarinibacter sp. C21-152]|uniref:Cytochrome c n=1 Tax=Psychromarinibacter sediminicola TaxID=3033385 RepID=A0AAE3NLB7_9RHOB|nr:cytochrome c [Psychromarinibacter sediminicola]MDF0599383.1 cytochrome c [Psychromarinibacter sediminicola]
MRMTFVAPLLAAIVAGGMSAARAQDSDAGAELYVQYCATCHGPSGRGDGPMSEILNATVPDLTRLAENNDGAFPMLEVIHIIDGRTGLRGHGGPMPTYGDIFTAEIGGGEPGDRGTALETRGRILSVALYLESIQE